MLAHAAVLLQRAWAAWAKVHILPLLQVLARAGGRYSLVQVREAVVALQNDGHLYSTIDENHFKSCDL